MSYFSCQAVFAPQSYAKQSHESSSVQKTATVARPPFRTTRRACEATPGRGRFVSIRDRSYRSWHARSGSDSAPGDGHATVDGHLAPALGSVGFDEGSMGEAGAGRARLHRALRRRCCGGYVPRPIGTSRIERTPTRGPLPCIAAGSSRASIASPLYPHGHPPRTFADPHTRTPDPPADSTEPLFHSGYPTTTSVTGSQFDLDVKVRARTAPDPTPAPLQKSKFTNGPARESLFSPDCLTPALTN